MIDTVAVFCEETNERIAFSFYDLEKFQGRLLDAQHEFEGLHTYPPTAIVLGRRERMAVRALQVRQSMTTGSTLGKICGFNGLPFLMSTAEEQITVVAEWKP